MNKTILYIAMSLDGFVAGRNDDISWLFRYNDVDYGFNEFFSGIGAIIQGRRTYDIELMNGWENVHPVPTFILSHRAPLRPLKRSDITFTNEDIEQVLNRARQLTSKDIWLAGGANVAQQFLARRLVDEIALSIVPVILGEGTSLFGGMRSRISLALQEIRQFDKGLVQIVYKVE